ncbi:glycine oxidase ThiO [Nocardia sp. SYP-A9097]|uniref:glycine oxidase ThiO n=1 Tax=Nocardia sp. SYP-A9097 TaxID=2663237 RepID=UPI001326245C|nr:glycine oxidase ThiO [Nocardia sp. SYP-A9097]MRH91922.1 glycine oxidase ThiO [Nocardia sp. SYP-A9097]
MRTLAVVGGGVIGLSVAWRAAEEGWTVTLFDPASGSGASWVAGGMLAPLSEGWPGEDDALEFGAASLTRWPDFAARLQARTGAELFTANRTLTVALDAADVVDLRTIADWVNAHDLPALPGDPGCGAADRHLRLLDRAGVRAAEPGLARAVRAGLLAASEPAVDNRALVSALRAACAAVGVEFIAEQVVSEYSPENAGEPIANHGAAHSESHSRLLHELPHDRIVVAAGAAAAQLWPALPVRPVKGEILRLRRRPSAPAPPQGVIRGRVHGRPIYLVPRNDGIVLGATQYEQGFDTAVTVAGVRDLITDAETILPGIGEYEFAEAAAGSRPGTPDNLPLIGYVDDRVIAATGHGRNGILCTPVTADAVLALLADTQLPEARAAAPDRFEPKPKGPRPATAAEERALSANYRRRASATPFSPGGAR